MSVLILVLILAGAVVLLALELFILPGLTLAGVASAILYFFGIYFAFAELGYTEGIFTIIASLLSVILTIRWFMKSKRLEEYALKETIADPINVAEKLNLQVGQQGITLTRLSLVGNASFNGLPVEVYSTEGLIEEQTPIEIVRIEKATIYVKKQS